MRPCRALFLAAAALTVCAGACTRVPPPAPLDAADVEAVMGELARAADGVAGLRGSGRGEASVGRRRLSFVYAFVYSRPGWLRADLRPEGAMLPDGLTTLLLLDEETVEAYLPHKMLAVTGRTDGVARALPWTDHAAVAAGLLDARCLSGLEGPSFRRDSDGMLVTGTSDDLTVRAVLDDSPPSFRELDVRGPQGSLSVRYSGHGWHAMEWLPRTTELTVSPADGETVVVTLMHDTARRADGVDRADYIFDVPSEATVVDWRDLSVWEED